MKMPKKKIIRVKTYFSSKETVKNALKNMMLAKDAKKIISVWFGYSNREVFYKFYDRETKFQILSGGYEFTGFKPSGFWVRKDFLFLFSRKEFIDTSSPQLSNIEKPNISFKEMQSKLKKK